MYSYYKQSQAQIWGTSLFLKGTLRHTHTYTLGETRGKTKLKGVYVCCDSQIIVYIVFIYLKIFQCSEILLKCEGEWSGGRVACFVSYWASYLDQVSGYIWVLPIAKNGPCTGETKIHLCGFTLRLHVLRPSLHVEINNLGSGGGTEVSIWWELSDSQNIFLLKTIVTCYLLRVLCYYFCF